MHAARLTRLPAVCAAALTAALLAPPAVRAAVNLPGDTKLERVDFERHIDYIHYNPVKHGLVTRVADWPYSSFHRYVAQGILSSDWAGDITELSGGFRE